MSGGKKNKRFDCLILLASPIGLCEKEDERLMLTRGQSPLPSILELPRHLGFIYPLVVRTSDFRVGEEFDLFSRNWIVPMNSSRF